MNQNHRLSIYRVFAKVQFRSSAPICGSWSAATDSPRRARDILLSPLHPPVLLCSAASIPPLRLTRAGANTLTTARSARLLASRCRQAPRRTRCRSGCGCCRRPASCRARGRSTSPHGKTAFSGTKHTTVCGPCNSTCLTLARGARAGSTTVPSPALPTFVGPSSCLLLHPSWAAGRRDSSLAGKNIESEMAKSQQLKVS